MNALEYAPFGGIGQTLFIGVAQPVLAVLPKPAGPSLRQVIDEVIASKKAGNRRPIYIHSLKHYLNGFARGREDMPITAVNLTTLEEWFAGRTETPASQRSNRGRLSSLFSYAKRKGYVSDNPVSRMDGARVDAKPPRVLSPAEAETLLNYLATSGRRRWRLPQVVLGLFTGIRPTELTRIYWRDVDLERAVVRVDASASKVRQRRIVPIPENAVAWLRLCPRHDKAIGARRWKWIADVERGTGLKWDKDLLRHSAASYLVARHEDVGRCARWLGNSADVILRHYTELVSAEDCERYWNIYPSLQPRDNMFTRAEAGRFGRMARSTLTKVKFVMKHADEETLRRIRSGWLCMSDAWDALSAARQ